MTEQQIHYAAHFFGGFWIATGCQFLGNYMMLPAVAVGVGKVLYDKTHGGNFNWIELLCTCVGGFVGWVVKLIYS
jgi:putative effector of murein hydrolase LrgA (UPF0299 family)